MHAQAAVSKDLATDQVVRLDARGSFVDRQDLRIAQILRDTGFLNVADAMTVTGQPLTETLKVSPNGDGKIIKTMAEPLAKEGGLIFLEGSLAPDGALVKRSAVPKTLYKHEGPARIFVT